MATRKETWETESGLPDDFDCVVESAQFGFLAEYQGGVVPLLIWNVESPDADIDTIAWSIGKDWTPSNDGSTVSHAKGRTKFVNTSMYGRLIDRLVKNLQIDMSKYGPSTNAGTWAGLGFHMRREKLQFAGGAERGMKAEVEHLMPVAFLDKKAAPKGKQQSKAAPSTEESDDADVRTQLTKLAKSLTKDKFQTAALKRADVVNDPELLNEVMEDGPSGFYQKAKA